MASLSRCRKRKRGGGAGRGDGARSPAHPVSQDGNGLSAVAPPSSARRGTSSWARGRLLCLSGNCLLASGLLVVLQVRAAHLSGQPSSGPKSTPEPLLLPPNSTRTQVLPGPSPKCHPNLSTSPLPALWLPRSQPPSALTGPVWQPPLWSPDSTRPSKPRFPLSC